LAIIDTDAYIRAPGEENLGFMAGDRSEGSYYLARSAQTLFLTQSIQHGDLAISPSDTKHDFVAWSTCLVLGSARAQSNHGVLQEFSTQAVTSIVAAGALLRC